MQLLFNISTSSSGLTHPSPQEDLAASSSEPPDNLDFFFFWKEESCWEPSCLVELIARSLIVSVGYHLQAVTHWDDAMRRRTEKREPERAN